MHILVVNCGSSSIKSSIIEHKTGAIVVEGRVERVGEGEPFLRINDSDSRPCAASDHKEGLSSLLPLMLEKMPEDAEIAAVGHRVVHGGAEFTRPVIIDEAVEGAIEALFSVAPLHNPPNLNGIRAARALLPDVEHIAVFDTAFHATLPDRARRYAIPVELAEKHGFRRFGFHGISHAYVAARAAEYLGSDVRDLRLITCHLGGGCSIAAVEYGRSVETSMGYTPLEGVVMGTRSGDIDPGLLLALMREEGIGPDEVDRILNRESGLAGLSGVGNDLRDIENRAEEGDERCRRAMQVFAHRVRKYIGAYTATMGGVDAIIFTAGIGENSAQMRHRIAQRFDFLGAFVDEERNRGVKLAHDEPVFDFSTRNSRTRLLAVLTNEELAIAQQVAKLSMRLNQTSGQRKIPVAISARHVHLTQDVVEKLFGPGHTLTERNPLSQPGQFAAEETVTVVGPRRSLERVRILGPCRTLNQVEIARTDEFHLGIDAPVRASGDIENSPGCTLIGPHGEVELKSGVICAQRHIHMTPDDAEHFGVKNGDIVEVGIDSEGRNLIFGDVLIRVSPSFKLEMHIDTDEGNAAQLNSGMKGALLSTEGTAVLRRRDTRYDAVT